MKFISIVTPLALGVVVAGCFSNSDETTIAVPFPEIQINGVVAAGLAECEVTAFSPDGDPVSNTWTGAQTPFQPDGAPTEGRFELTIENYAGPAFIEAENCTYVDETTNKVMIGASLTAGIVVPGVDNMDINEDEPSVTAVVSPMTSVAVNISVGEQGNKSDADAESIETANRLISDTFFGSDIDITTTIPVISTDETAKESDEASKDYGLYLAAISGAGELTEVVKAIARGIDKESGDVSATTEELLLEGAAAFEASGFKAIERDTLKAVSRIRTKGVKMGTAPNISISTPVLTATEGSRFAFRDFVTVEDPDSDLRSVRFRQLPRGVSAVGATGVEGRINRAGEYNIVVVARDEVGNASSERIVLRVEGTSPDADPTPSAEPPSASTSPSTVATPGTSTTPATTPPTVASAEPVDPVVEPVDTVMDTPEEVVRFLMRSGFGGTKDEIDALVGTDAADWVKAQLAMPGETILEATIAAAEAGRTFFVNGELNYNQLNGTDDHLRERMKFALSQILVVSHRVGEPIRISYYIDILSQHAFGNYRDLLHDVTYSPMMGLYLTYNDNIKGDPATGRTPDENYAREILQLFSIGLSQLDEKGQPLLDADGNTIDTYTQEDIEGLARVFTGFRTPVDPSISGFLRPGYYRPMVMFPSRHSPLEKTFIGQTIPAGTEGEASVSLALDHIFFHPNVGPFIGRQLIQRFTSSHPDPDYVGRVANAFNTGSFTAPGGQRFGTGRRGDLEATIAAVLLEPSLFDDTMSMNEGKIREPILRFAGWAHSFDIANVDSRNHYTLDRSSGKNGFLGQHPYASPSVFNFYRPGYIAPESVTGDNNLNAPELQIRGTFTRDDFINFMIDYVFDRSTKRDPLNRTYVPDYSDLIDLVDRPDELVDHLDVYLTGGRMSNITRSRIREILALYEVRPANEAEDKSLIVKLAVTMAIASPAFTVIY